MLADPEREARAQQWLLDRHTERVLAMSEPGGGDITVRRVSRALGCSDDQAREAILALTERGSLRRIVTPDDIPTWERVG